MKNAFALLIMVLLFGCRQAPEGERLFCLQGAWMLQRVEYPTGTAYNYPTDDGITLCRIYSRDSSCYDCRMTATPTGLVIMPNGVSQMTLVNKGGGELLYLEDGDPHPLTITSDSTITIQRNGIRYYWLRDDAIYREWGNEMQDIIARENDRMEAAAATNFVLSSKERQQESTIHWLIFAIALILLLAVQYVIASLRSRRRLQLQLRQIQEEHTERAQSVRQAMKAEEERFFASDDYSALQQRMADGQRLREQDWADVEQRLKTVYPGFTSQLRGLYPMSELEYHTCLLIKLCIAPKDIAAVLARDVSTISTVRSRLYKKVFGRKGGTKEWDDFILSIGA